jgi:hypothetical protein
MGGAPPPPPPPPPSGAPQFEAPPGAPTPQPGVPSPAAPGTTGVEVTTGFMKIAFLYYFFKPTVVIDGVPTKVTWGTQFFGLQPGRHHVHVFFRYIFMDAGKGDVDLDFAPGQVRRIRYRAPWFVFSRGKITEL